MGYNTGLSSEIDRALDRLDERLARGTTGFLTSLWDGESGGFYYSIGAKKHKECAPDSDSTAQVLRLIDSGAFLGSKGALASTLSDGLRERILSFAASCEDSASVKWIKDSLEGKGDTDKSARSAARPIIGAPSVRDHLESREAFEKFLSDNSATALDLRSQYKEIKSAGLSDVMFEYLDSVQERVMRERTESGLAPTGLWQAEITSNAMSELARLASLYTEGERRVSYAAEIVGTCIGEILSYGKYESISEIYAPWAALSAVLKNIGTEDGASLYNTVRRSAPDMISSTAERLEVHKGRHGGFFYYPSRRSARLHGARVAFRIADEDVNSTVTAVHGIRGSIFSSLGLTVPPIWGIDALNDILSKISK